MKREKIEKPFYMKPPINILFEVGKLSRVRLWEISVSFLLRIFLEEMKKWKMIDFRASGVALDSSAEIYLQKAKLLLKLEEPPPAPAAPKDVVPAPILIPARFELTSTTVKDLLKVLDEVLKRETLIQYRRPREIELPPMDLLPSVDRYLLEVEKSMKEVFSKLLEYANYEEVITFSKFVSGLDKLEAIRIFILLLFLAQKGDVTLWQDREFDEIYISISGESGSGAAGIED